MTPLSVKVLPDGFPEETHSGFNITSSGHLVSNGLYLEDSDTYHFSTAAYDGLLTVAIVVNGMLVCVSAASGECSSLQLQGMYWHLYKILILGMALVWSYSVQLMLIHCLCIMCGRKMVSILPTALTIV